MYVHVPTCIMYMQFYIAESSLELLARHMMFLALISEPLDRLGLQGKPHLSLHGSEHCIDMLEMQHSGISLDYRSMQKNDSDVNYVCAYDR